MDDQTKIQRVAQDTATATVEAMWPQTRAILRVIFVVLAVAGFIWIVYRLEQVLLLVIFAIFFAYLIAPLVEFVRRPIKLRNRERLMPRALAIGVVYLLIFGGIGLAGYVLLPRLGDQLSQFTQQAPTYLLTARGRTQKLSQLYQRIQLPVAARDAVNAAALNAVEEAGNYLQAGALGMVKLLAYIPWLVLIPILAFFLLKDAESFRRSALEMLPRGRLRWRGDEFFQDVNGTLAAYIRAQITACIIVGVICSIGFMIIGVPYSLLLGVVAGLFEFVPLAGPFAVIVIVSIITSFYSTNAVIAVILFLIVLRLVNDYVIYPRIIGQGIHLHPLAVVLAILCGEELAGLTGIFLAIPVVAIISVTYRHWLEHRGSHGLVADFLQPDDVNASTPALAPAPDGVVTSQPHQ